MDSLEFNKVAAGLLVGLLLAFGIGKLGSVLYAPAMPDREAVEAPVETAQSDEPATPEAPAAPAVPIAVFLASADLVAGEKQFRKCKSCHTVEAGGADGQGPNLYGIVGAARASNPDFRYSAAVGGMDGVWTFDELSAYLTNPKDYAPGTRMIFRGIADDQDRADLIAWLNTQSDAPLPLPAIDESAASSPVDRDGVAGADVAADGDARGTDVAARVAAASVRDGRKVARTCRSCHTFEEDGADRVGPNLWNTVGRDIASREDYRYSGAMEAEEGAWTLERLWTYLEDPREDIPGTRMGFRGIGDDGELAAVLAYLHSLSPTPAPLAGSE